MGLAFRTLACLALLAWLGAGALGADWQTLVQPRGDILDLMDPNAVNATLAAQGYTYPPFETTTTVTEIRTNVTEYFVRVYNPSQGSQQLGGWIMRAAYVRGLAPEELRDRFALPFVPTHLTYVVVPPGEMGGVPSGSLIWTGIANAVPGWGDGGAQQSLLRGTYIPAGSYQLAQLLGAQALVYSPNAGGGNEGRVAAYLDGMIPAAYTDLETVYTTLDYVNYQGAGPLRQAMNSMGPGVYDAYTREAVEQNELLNSILAARLRGAPPASPAGQDGAPGQGLSFWARGAGQFVDRDARSGLPGYSARTSGLVVGADTRPEKDCVAGAYFGYLRSDLSFDSGLGHGQVDRWKGGFYGGLRQGAWFADGAAGAGFSRAETTRRVAFLAMDRKAHSNQDGWDISAFGRFGRVFDVKGWTVETSLGAAYLYERREGFTESGADSLDLDVSPIVAQTLRAALTASVARTFRLSETLALAPSAVLGLVHETPLDSRRLTAGLKEQPGTFSTVGSDQEANRVLAGLGLAASVGKRVSVALRLESETGQDGATLGVWGGVDWGF